MGIFEMLKADHLEIRDKVESLLDESPSDPHQSNKVDLFFDLKLTMVSHNRAEETSLYDFMAKKPETMYLVVESKDEHLEVEELLQDLEGLNPQDYSWRNTVILLKEKLELHLDREEDLIFERARKVLSEEENLRLAEDYETLRAEIIEGYPYHPMGRSKINPVGLNLRGS
jgi:hemerythrin superfamily protein